MPVAATACIYKICDQADWQNAIQANVFAGAGPDLQDGFIHFSAPHQLRATAEKYFSGQNDLMLLEVAVADLPVGSLKWEASRGGALFPHLYAPLPTGLVRRFWPLPADGTGHCFPEELNI
ncbi:MAG: DUF952 domain-containing protein [Parvibaculales bacterium]